MVGVTARPDLTGSGTPEDLWTRSLRLAGLPIWDPQPGPSERVLLVAPHPDDEILGAGGTAARLSACGAEVVVVAGPAASAGSGRARRQPPWKPWDWPERRRSGWG